MALWSVNKLPIGSESTNLYRPTENPDSGTPRFGILEWF